MERASDRRAGWSLLLLALGLVCEGFDLQIANFAAGDMMRTLHLGKAEFAPFLSASLFGMLIGAPTIGRLGDRAGRRVVIAGGTLAYGVLTLVTTQFASLWPLVALRFLTGVALGGVMPNIFALASEVAPERLRTKAVAIIGIGISSGGLAAGSVASALAESGWRTLFLIAGIVPLAMAAALWFWLPEARMLTAKERREPLRALFAGPLKWVTPAIWLVFVITLMTVYLLTSWLPVMLHESGMSARGAALVATGYQFGSMLGCVVTALLIGRSGWRQIAAFAVCAAVSLAVTAALSGHGAAVTIGLIATGFFVVGTQNGLNGATAAAYPGEARATGLGWGLGLGRIGSMIGPLAGGFAATLGSDVARTVLGMQVVPLLLAAAVAMWIGARVRTPAEP